MAAKSCFVSFKGEKMINGGEKGTKERKKANPPSEKEEYKEGDDETAEMAEEKTHCNASFTLVRPSPWPSPPDPLFLLLLLSLSREMGLGRRFPVGRRCAVIMRKEVRRRDGILGAEEDHQAPDGSNQN